MQCVYKVDGEHRWAYLNVTDIHVPQASLAELVTEM